MVLYIFAWDESGSTDSIRFYFETGIDYLQKFNSIQMQNDEDEKIYIKWGTSCHVSSYSELMSICVTKKGRGGGTCPSEIVKWIINRGVSTTESRPKTEPIELWLITDGDIDQYELAKCSELNKQVSYVKINFVIISQTRWAKMSVGAAFFRGASIEIYYNASLYKSIDISVPFDYKSITLCNFEANWEKLNDFIQAKFMGSDYQSLEEIDKLKALRKRLLDALAAENMKNKNNEIDLTRPEFSSKSKNDIISILKQCQFYKTLTSTTTKNRTLEIDSSISTLINYIHNKHKSFEFLNLKIDFQQDKMENIQAIEEPKLEELIDEIPVTFYDAVTLEEEAGQPILLIHTTDLIEKLWVNGSYSKFRYVIDCPFFAELDEAIGHVFNVETYKSLVSTSESNGTGLKNPMTNLDIFGGILLSSKADKWNDYVLTRSFFRGKVVTKNLSIWYYMIWQCCIGKSWIEASVLEKLKMYAIYRIKSMGRVRLAFSTLPLDPSELVPLPIACFYCAELSSSMFGEHSTLFAHERLRMYSAVASHFLNVLEIFDYTGNVDKEFVQERAKVLSIVNQLKRIPQVIEKRYFLLKMVLQTVKEGSIEFLCFNIADKSKIPLMNLLKYGHKEMIPFNVAKAINNKTLSDLSSYILTNYKYTTKHNFKISKQTFRPYFVVRNEANELISNYTQILDCIENVKIDWTTGETNFEPMVDGKFEQRRLASLCKDFINLTTELNNYPILNQYMEYVAKYRRLNEGNLIRLFEPTIINEIKLIFAGYTKMIETENVPIQKFIAKTKSTISVTGRIDMEQRFTKEFGYNPYLRDNFIENARTMLV